MKIAVLLTVYNRVEKTVRCLNSLFRGVEETERISYDVYLTDDGSSDGTEEEIKKLFPQDIVYLLKGNGNLFWNGGMINSWKAALNKGGYNGYLWLNNDTEVLPNLWNELMDADRYSNSQFGQGGIYVGSTCDKGKTRLTYGGFIFTDKWILKDKFIIPNGTFQPCQCAHGNVTYVSQDVVDKQGILFDKYLHGGSDHDYTYRAYKRGLPIFVLRDFVGICENDHDETVDLLAFNQMSLKERIRFLNSPMGYNLKNTLLFQQRCFPYRVPFVWLLGYMKALFPKSSSKLYKYLRNR
jgi:GT2 family glycosyltransferase